MNKQVFVANAISKTKTLQQLVAKEISLYATSQATLLTTNATNIAPAPAVTESLYIGLGKASGGAIVSREIVKKGLRNLEYKKFPYRALVNQVFTVTFACAANIGDSDRDEWVLKVRTDSDIENQGVGTFVESYSVMGKYATATALYAAMAASVDLGTTELIKTVTSSGSGVVITAKDGKTLSITSEYVKDIVNTCVQCTSCVPTVVKTTEADMGSGTAIQVRQLIAESLVYNGRGWIGNAIFKDPATDFPIADNFQGTTYYLKWTNANQPMDSHTAAAFDIYQEQFVIIESGTTAQDVIDFEAALTAQLGVAIEIVTF